jgi:hypothetical protein
MRIDVVVTDRAGQAVAGLKYSDFSLLDNGQPRKIISFRPFPAVTELHPLVSVFLLIDTVCPRSTDNISAKENAVMAVHN